MQTVLRLLCLASILTGGIKVKTLENLKREILQVGGVTCSAHNTIVKLHSKARLLRLGI